MRDARELAPRGARVGGLGLKLSPPSDLHCIYDRSRMLRIRHRVLRRQPLIYKRLVEQADGSGPSLLSGGMTNDHDDVTLLLRLGGVCSTSVDAIALWNHTNPALHVQLVADTGHMIEFW